MPLIFSAIVPHPPLLIPTIGKENIAKIKTTDLSYRKIAQKMEQKKIDTIIVISPHGDMRLGAFTINLNPQVSSDFKVFGDFSTEKTWSTDINLAYKIREYLETKASLQLMNNGVLDHGASIPLYLLTQNLPGVKVVPIIPSALGLDDHFKFGQQLKKQIFLNNQNIAVIASGDLSHRLTKDAPAGFSSKGKKFDKKLIELLLNKNYTSLVSMDPEFIDEAGECGLRPILIHQGLMEGINYQPKLHSYEGPFGVGYMVMEFIF